MVANVLITTIGSLSNDDEDGNEKGKKSNRFRACLHGGGGPQVGGVYHMPI